MVGVYDFRRPNLLYFLDRFFSSILVAKNAADFPFISYYMINTQQTDPASFYSGIRGSSLTKFEPKKLR